MNIIIVLRNPFCRGYQYFKLFDGLGNSVKHQLQDPEFLTQLTLDVSVLPSLKDIADIQLGSLEIFKREFVFNINNQRFAALKNTG